MPVPFRAGQYLLYQLISIFHVVYFAGSQPAGVPFGTAAAAGTATTILGLGLTSLVNPILSVLFTLPWFAGAFLQHTYSFAHMFTLFDSQYYSYGLGGSVVAAILGLRLLSARGIKPVSKLGALGTYENLIAISTIVISIIIAAYTLTLVPASINAISLDDLLLHTNSTINYSQINSVLTSIPQNASVIAQGPIAAHLFYLHNIYIDGGALEYISKANASQLNTQYWFTPEYIVLDKNLRYYGTNTGSVSDEYNFSIYAWMGNNYTQYYNESGLEVYRIK